ncbi:hypothetical protein C0Q70_08310 [Pomacea canaliculata]|uniref:FYVE-type domain-containing protein n=1 Tax=Pomacea canaliculata TaxID=400727 RepID=A0A2T7PHG0_POMCA|nr:hypothetical protein C0Q70_08310 [Pomacea canaliculata]
MGAGAVTGHSQFRGSRVFPSPAPAGNSATTSSDTSFTRTAPKEKSDLQGQPGIKATMSNKPLSCETCDVVFNLFKRRKFCKDCRRCFCSTCLPKPSNNNGRNGRQCSKCIILTSGKFTRQMLQAWKIKDMRCFLDARSISTSSCKEKHDLIDLLLLHFCLESNSTHVEQAEHDRLVDELASRMQSSSFCSFTPLPSQVSMAEHFSNSAISEATDSSYQEQQEQSSSVQSTGNNSSNRGLQNVTEDTERGNDESDGGDRNLRERQEQETLRRYQEELRHEEPETRPGIKRATLEDVKCESDVDSLTVRQLKEILVNNFVDYRGCCEKRELRDHAKRLWKEDQANKQRATAAHEESKAPNASSGKTSAMPGVPLDLEYDIYSKSLSQSLSRLMDASAPNVTKLPQYSQHSMIAVLPTVTASEKHFRQK